MVLWWSHDATPRLPRDMINGQVDFSKERAPRTHSGEPCYVNAILFPATTLALFRNLSFVAFFFFFLSMIERFLTDFLCTFSFFFFFFQCSSRKEGIFLISFE